ncbi:hypothetical protein [Deinococcus knuensis]|uniref:Transposase IS4-like domain-containing protein n=1 Tax=Deinococcus knuensis TaxID=1837380 RepID=A0ABQ2T363_9DEIO|nr:hypothetical protein [Deinococcus knuensis]GGS44908.1 hypothetical protein GCM10008961_39420 [Deinococcus knuensis]
MLLEHSSAQVDTDELLPVLAETKGLLDFVGIRQVRLLADRGFCDTDLMAWLQHCGWTYRIRIKSTLILSTPDGQRLCKIGDVKLQPSVISGLPSARLPAGHSCRYHAVHEHWDD